MTPRYELSVATDPARASSSRSGPSEAINESPVAVHRLRARRRRPICRAS